jgi:recombination protein RecT
MVMVNSEEHKKQVVLTNKDKIIIGLNKIKPNVQRVIPGHMKIERICRLALNELHKNPKLQECTPRSFLSAVTVASQLGLEVGVLGAAYLVPYSNKGVLECNLIPGYRGLMDLAYRSGVVMSIGAEIVYDVDEFYFDKGVNSTLVHKPSLKEPRVMIAAYAIAKLTNGEHQFFVMSKQRIDEVKARAKSQYGPWVSDYEAMARKTVVRRLFTWLPSSIEMRQAAILDEHQEIGIQNMSEFAMEETDLGEIFNTQEFADGTQSIPAVQSKTLAEEI